VAPNQKENPMLTLLAWLAAIFIGTIILAHFD